MYWCVSLLIHCSRQQCLKCVHVLPSLTLLCPELGLSDVNETAHVIVAGAFILRRVIMLTRLAQRLGCSMQRVQQCVRGINAGFRGLWAYISFSTTSSSLPLTGTKASVPAAAIFQASAAPYRSPCNVHQSMMQQFRSGGPPPVRPLHGTAGYSSPALQQDRIAGDHGNVSTAVPDQDVASDDESEVFEDAVAEMQPDLLLTAAPLQVKAAAKCVHWCCLTSTTSSS